MADSVIRLQSSSSYAHPARQLSKLIAALERQWREELGGPEAAATALVLRKAHGLLKVANADQPAVFAPGQRLRDYLGAAWVDLNPWAAGPIDKIDATLKQSFRAGNDPGAQPRGQDLKPIFPESQVSRFHDRSENL